MAKQLIRINKAKKGSGCQRYVMRWQISISVNGYASKKHLTTKACLVEKMLPTIKS